MTDNRKKEVDKKVIKKLKFAVKTEQFSQSVFQSSRFQTN